MIAGSQHGSVVRNYYYYNYEVSMKFKIINLLNGAVTVVVAKSYVSALKKGRDYFSEPNRNKVPVQAFN